MLQMIGDVDRGYRLASRDLHDVDMKESNRPMLAVTIDILTQSVEDI